VADATVVTDTLRVNEPQPLLVDERVADTDEDAHTEMEGETVERAVLDTEPDVVGVTVPDLDTMENVAERERLSDVEMVVDTV
jgi:hypothetical protein